MTRETRIRIQHRAQLRRRGETIEPDREEGKAMAEAMLAGETVASIAQAHALPRRRVQRRLFTMGVYQVRP